jgi:hypothetical protein
VIRLIAVAHGGVFHENRESAEELYEAQRQARLRERKAEVEEYRRSYMMGTSLQLLSET